MESEVFDYELLKKSPMFVIKQYVNAIYKGELIDNKRHGKGVMIYGNNDRAYEGNWHKDLRHG